MKDKQKMKEVTLRLTQEEFQAFDSARSMSGLKFQTILHGFMTAFVHGSSVPKTEQTAASSAIRGAAELMSPNDSLPATQADTTEDTPQFGDILEALESMSDAIKQLAKEVRANKAEHGGVRPARTDHAADMPLHTRPKR